MASEPLAITVQTYFLTYDIDGRGNYTTIVESFVEASAVFARSFVFNREGAHFWPSARAPVGMQQWPMPLTMAMIAYNMAMAHEVFSASKATFIATVIGPLDPAGHRLFKQIDRIAPREFVT